MRGMATPNDIASRPKPKVNHLTRILVCLLGVGAIGWGLFALPLFWQESSFRSVAAKLLQGDSFKPQLVSDEAQKAEKAAQYQFCNPDALRSLFVLRLFILTGAIETANRELAAASYTPLDEAARQALACAPVDSFVWLALFWLDAGKYGLNARNASYLRLSYVLGRNEGWIALWRVRLALLLFERLPADLATDAVDDFINLVNTGQMYGKTATIFKDASPAIQSRIVEQLKGTRIAARQIFARELHYRGMDIEIPGLEKPAARPWR